MKVNRERVTLSATHGSESRPLFRVGVEAFRAQRVASQCVAVHVIAAKHVNLRGQIPGRSTINN